MSVRIHRPATKDPAKAFADAPIPQFSMAKFHEIASRPQQGSLIEIAPRALPVATAWELANFPPAPAMAADHASPPGAPLQPRQPMPEPQSAKGAWRRHIGSAKLTWSKLTSAELERIDGDRAKLSELLLRHYSFDRYEADQQVKSFFDRN